MRCHSSSKALGTRTGYWIPTQRGTNETPRVKAVLKSRQQALRAYCPNVNTVLGLVSLKGFMTLFKAFFCNTVTNFKYINHIKNFLY